MTPQTIQIILAFILGFILGGIVIGNTVLWYFNRKEEDKWLDDDDKWGY